MVRFSAVFVTRPEPQASALAARLEKQGIHTISSPAFRFEGIAVPAGLPANIDSAPVRLLVFTSPRAVEFGLCALRYVNLDDFLVAAIGPATAGALVQAGLQPLAVAGGHHTSEDLLAHPQLRGQRGAAVMVTAPGGRGVLAPGLGSLGWTCETLEVYRRIPCPPARETSQQLAAATGVISTWTSAEAMRNLLGALEGGAPEAVLGGCFIAASPRLADVARELGATAVKVADSASNDDLATAVIAGWHEQNATSHPAPT